MAQDDRTEAEGLDDDNRPELHSLPPGCYGERAGLNIDMPHDGEVVLPHFIISGLAWINATFETGTGGTQLWTSPMVEVSINDGPFERAPVMAEPERRHWAFAARVSHNGVYTIKVRVTGEVCGTKVETQRSVTTAETEPSTLDGRL